jgi:APA family basic amino acid/polyamine antiporter
MSDCLFARTIAAIDSSATTINLRRTIGRWSLTALIVNGIIGSGIFGLPSEIARLLGRASPLAYIVAAGIIGIIIACFAEVAARFRDAGGPYLYAQSAFGRLPGIQMAWLAWLTRLTATAANLNLLVIYLAEFWPHTGRPLPRLLVLTIAVAALATINYRGVSIGARVSNGFASIKVLSLFAFAVAGSGYLLMHGSSPHTFAPATVHTRGWLSAILMLMFLFGGFESALISTGETSLPARDNPFALLTAWAVVTGLFTLIQLVVIEILPTMTTDRPLAEAARQFSGGIGASAMAAAAIISVSGNLAAGMLTAPRLTFALAERGDFPRLFAAIHPRFRTPHVSIVVFAVLTWVLAVEGGFGWNVALSAVARVVTYGAVCAALPVLRRKYQGQQTFCLPADPVLAALGVAFSAILVTGIRWVELFILLATAMVATLNWLSVRRRLNPVPAQLSFG